MNKHKFESLCTHVLVRQMGRLLHEKLTPIRETLDSVAQELVRLRQDIEAQSPRHDAIDWPDFDD